MNVFVMHRSGENSLDLLRLFAAVLVLYSHQFTLLGVPEPLFFGLGSFGSIGVAIFFFLSGMLIWSSWERDPDWGRFFGRRALRVFPALSAVVLATVFFLGPAVTTLSWSDYFASFNTWRYLGNALLLVNHYLPGVFVDNPFPGAVNGSLWTLPLEFFCYCTVAVLGSIRQVPAGLRIGGGLLCCVMLASFAPNVLGSRFVPHFEMIAVFWWGVFYGYCKRYPPGAWSGNRWFWLLAGSALIGFAILGGRGLERTGVLVCAFLLVHFALRLPYGKAITAPLGDLSYGVYIFAFPVQQLFVYLGRDSAWSWGGYFSLSLFITLVLAFGSWHVLEKRALLFKPVMPIPNKAD